MQAAGYIADDVQKNTLPELTEKDERDIQKELENIIKGLKTGNGFAAFGGVDIDELDEEDRELLIASLENSLRLAKRIAKQKFTPKKYRKE
ncbi:Immunity repressor protein, phage-related protein [Geobacillus thermoleovorans CCB_US3_UF5]|uniref:Immunity repressor protein, phage-related protein n=3 Tax=root TaxID=1 RepID=U2X5G9_GEOKU|nr:Immunity repressor protein, phage-related protein [Geobacillus thermoleovorans CCB_US3_UF5]GAD14150.1 immunity repressor protein, phage-related protein [Geobacillus kaustophilus GBlys]